MKDWNEIKAWRKEQRVELVARRVALAAGERQGWNERVNKSLEAFLPVAPGTVVGFCWPFKSEIDARFAVRHWREQGAVAALPEVVDKKGPLEFREWWPGAPMRPGVYDIPVPDGTRVLIPDIAIVPMNGFDGEGFRLGYGGGYFDRTLAALERRVLAVGVSFETLRLTTIYPQVHDIPMDFVVTEMGVQRGGGNALARLDDATAMAEAKALLARRELPRNRVMAQTTDGGGYASPACSAHEIAPDYFGTVPPLSVSDLIELLNVLLEAERAGAKVLAAFMDEYERDTPAWRQLAAVQRDESKNCAILLDLIRRVNGTPSAKTGDFVEKALAIKGRVARLQFLNRGQLWVARKISEALPSLEQDFVRGALVAMHDSHLLNIEACDALAETLEA